MLKQSEWYAITIAPSDAWQQWSTDYSGTDRLTEWYGTTVKEVVKLLEQHTRFKLYPEISSSGRLHLHGCFVINDLIQFELYTIQRLKRIGIIDIDTIDNTGKWEMYCMKDRFKMIFYCHENFCPWEINNNFHKDFVEDIEKQFRRNVTKGKYIHKPMIQIKT